MAAPSIVTDPGTKSTTVADAAGDEAAPAQTTAWQPDAAARGVILMVGLTTIASVVNYGSNVVFGRMLPAASYGDFTALLALTVIIAVPTAAAQTVIADRVAIYMHRGDAGAVRYLMRHAFAHVGLIALVLGVVYLAATPLVVELLDLRAIGPALALAPLLMMTFFLPVVYGLLQGLDRFVALGLIVFGVAASRLVFGVPWTNAGGGAGGPIGGQAVGSLFAILIALYVARDMLIARGTGAAMSGLRRRLDRRALAAGGGFIAFALLSNLDVLLAKVFLSPDEAGSYAALATVGKIVLFLPSAVSMVMVPYAARARDATGSALRVLRVSALAVAAVTAAVAVPAVISPETVLHVIYGDRYASAADGVLPIVLAGAVLALIYLLVVYTVSIQDHRWVYLLMLGVGLQVAAIAAFHGSAVEVAAAQAAVVVTVLLVNELAFHPILRAERLLRRGGQES